MFNLDSDLDLVLGWDVYHGLEATLKKLRSFTMVPVYVLVPPKGVRIRCTPHTLEKFNLFVYGLEQQQQQQQKSNMGWLFFNRYVTFYENVNV